MAVIPPGCMCLGPAPVRTRRAKGCAVAARIGGKTSLLRQEAAQSATLAAAVAMMAAPLPIGLRALGAGTFGVRRVRPLPLPPEFV